MEDKYEMETGGVCYRCQGNALQCKCEIYTGKIIEDFDEDLGDYCPVCGGLLPDCECKQQAETIKICSNRRFVNIPSWLWKLCLWIEKKRASRPKEKYPIIRRIQRRKLIRELSLMAFAAIVVIAAIFATRWYWVWMK